MTQKAVQTIDNWYRKHRADPEDYDALVDLDIEITALLKLDEDVKGGVEEEFQKHIEETADYLQELDLLGLLHLSIVWKCISR